MPRARSVPLQGKSVWSPSHLRPAGCCVWEAPSPAPAPAPFPWPSSWPSSSSSQPSSSPNPDGVISLFSDEENEPSQNPGSIGMATPAPADEVNANAVIKRSASEEAEADDGREPPARMEEERGSAAAQDEATPAHFPLSTHEQLQAMARRREAALCFKHQVDECRLALKYSVIGWTGTLDLAKIPAALSNAPSIRDLDKQMDSLQRKLAPFLPPPSANQNDNDNNLANLNRGLGAEALARVEEIRRSLLDIMPGVKSTRHIKPVLGRIEQAARDAGILPPEDSVGWVWSLSFDDWFIWHQGDDEFVSAKHDIRTDFVAA